jgi:putative transcriptional regulator
MIAGIMVRSRLKAIIAARNAERIQKDLPPLTVRGLAEEIDTSPSVITGLTANRAKRVDLLTLNKLCKALDCQVGDILVYAPDAPKEVH